ncbi:MAG: hypothetical protein ACYTGX_06905, partial [Planctomycetota bacterium]
MPDPTYDDIAPLIAEENQNGSTMHVTFRCPDTGIEAKATASVKQLKTVKSTAARSLKRSLWYQLRRAVTSAIS